MHLCSYYYLFSLLTGKQGVVERCSFENGLCLWAESESDTPGAKWTRQRGQDVWPKSGPPRDHTKNSAAGLGCQKLFNK